MTNIKNYPIKPFSLNQKVLGYDNSQTLSVTMKEIVDNINQGAAYQDLVDLINSIDNAISIYPTYGLAKVADLPVDRVVFILGNPSQFDGNGGLFIVKDTEEVNNTLPLDNGRFLNDLLITPRVKDTEQLGSVSIASNVYTFTPDSGVFRPLATGLVIKFFLPATANTAAVDINYNGTTVDFTWIDSSEFASGDLDDTYNKQMITARYDGTGFRCLSDISGQNSNGRWDKKSNGALICQQEKTDASNVTTASGSLFRSVIDQSWTYPKEFSDSAVVNQGSVLDINGADIGVFTLKFYSKSTTSVSYEFWSAVSVSSTGVSHELLSIGRWY